jgi:serine/threonine protein kinase
MSNLIGKPIDRYHIVEQLGEGGMATVYKAYDTRLERDVAFKVIRKEAFGEEVFDSVLARFDREAKSLAKFLHQGIVPVLDFGEHEGSPYIVMVYVPGGTLKENVEKPIPYQEAAALVAQIARALAFAHKKGVVHRDIKPANIMLTEDGKLMVSDFGIAKILDTPGSTVLTRTGVGIGTPAYMSPEQGLGEEIDHRTDIYSLGVVFYELVTGKKPFTADTPMAVIFKHVSDPLPRPRDIVPDLPEEVEKVIFKALAKQPEARYVDMGAFARALEQLVQEVTGQAVTPVPLDETPKHDT